MIKVGNGRRWGNKDEEREREKVGKGRKKAGEKVGTKGEGGEKRKKAREKEKAEK